MSDQKKLNRRDFLKGAAISGAGLAAVGALGASSTTPVAAQVATPAPTATSAVQYGRPGIDDVPVAATPCPSNLPAKWDYEADVIVVGTGPTGAVSAVVAVEAGAKVILLDQNKEFGGQGVINGGGLLIGGGTRIQKLNGIDDTPDKLFAHFSDPKVFDYRRHNLEVLRAYCDYSPITFDWLEKHGVKFADNLSPLDMGGVNKRTEYNHAIMWNQPTVANPQATGTYQSGAGLTNPLKTIATEKGVGILLEHKMTKLIREGNMSGRVLGVQVEAGGKKLNFKARRGVVLASGSWKGHKWLRTLYDPRMTPDLVGSGEPFVQCDGSSIQAGLEIGGVLATDSASSWHEWHRHFGTLYHNFPLGSPYAKPGLSIGTAQAGDVIFVNGSGKRFVSEGALETDEPGGSFYDSALPQKDHILWVIFDDAAAKKNKWNLVPPYVEPNLVFSASSLSELAALIKVPPDALSTTVSNYNKYVTDGSDPDFGKPKNLLTSQITAAPFHAVWLSLQIHDTCGGLAINAKGQVMDIYGQVIPRLYAGGECAGSLIFDSGMVRCVVFGLICAENAAAEKPWG